MPPVLLRGLTIDTGTYQYGDPSPSEQAHLERINRVRLDLQAEAERLLGGDINEGITDPAQQIALTLGQPSMTAPSSFRWPLRRSERMTMTPRSGGQGRGPARANQEGRQMAQIRASALMGTLGHGSCIKSNHEAARPLPGHACAAGMGPMPLPAQMAPESGRPKKVRGKASNLPHLFFPRSDLS